MKVLFWTILVAGGAWLTGCGGSTGQPDETPADSQMVAEHIDPSTKFPQQLVQADTLQTDAQFVDNAIQSVRETITLASLAAQKATREDIKKAAQNMMPDLRSLQGALQKVQQQKQPGDSAAKYNDGSVEELEKLAGAAFDRQWVEKMVVRNAAMISRYEAASGAAKDKDIKRIANDALPALKAHQQQLETCRAKLQ